MTIPAAARPPGWATQPERTTLAWTRTSLGFLANGALLMFKYLNNDASPVTLIAACFAAAVTLWMYLIGRRRQHLLARQPFPARISPRREVYEVTVVVLTLIVLTILSLIV